MDNQESSGTATFSPGTSPVHDPMAAADHAARRAGERLKSVADQLRAHAPSDGLAGQVAETVTSGVKHAATQLQEQGFGGLIDDLVGIARRYPVPLLILGIGGAFVLSRLRRD